MTNPEFPPSSTGSLPSSLRPLFWDQDFEHLDWHQHREFLIGRILEAGPWDAVCWLRRQVGDAALRDWIQRQQGRPLDAAQLRFWQLILDLPEQLVTGWLQSPERRIWEGMKEP
jgi:hypothetical protein